MNEMLMCSSSINLHFSDSAGVVASVLSLYNFLDSAPDWIGLVQLYHIHIWLLTAVL